MQTLWFHCVAGDVSGRIQNQKFLKGFPKASFIQIDDLETIEHTKCKPVSVTLAVEKGTRRIQGFTTSQMPSKGHLARIARKKYGKRLDLRPEGRKELFQKIRDHVHESALKRKAFDLLFSLNHTCAMFRANINRLFRKTWCTTKRIEQLNNHLELYVYFHNTNLI